MEEDVQRARNAGPFRSGPRRGSGRRRVPPAPRGDQIVWINANLSKPGAHGLRAIRTPKIQFLRDKKPLLPEDYDKLNCVSPVPSRWRVPSCVGSPASPAAHPDFAASEVSAMVMIGCYCGDDTIFVGLRCVSLWVKRLHSEKNEDGVHYIKAPPPVAADESDADDDG